VLPNVKFNTPEVSAFNRNIETPVSLYTGVPNINIPLFEINIKGVNVPIRLDYHSGGIRVDQEATWVGLGWNLSYGGEVSRKIRGIADEYLYMRTTPNSVNTVNNFMSLPNITSTPNSGQLERYERIKNAKYALHDYMPDEFYYSVLGYSGRFMFSQAMNKFVLFPREDIAIAKQNIAGNDNINFWNLKLPDGTSVDFGKNGFTAGEATAFGPKVVRNSWFIKTIRNNYNDSIVYDYDNFSYVTQKLSDQYYKFNSSSGYSGNTNFSSPNISDSRLKSITYSSGRLEFLTIARDDMPTRALSQIKVFDNSNNLVKNIEFVYSYFNGSYYDVLSIVNPILAGSIPNNYKYKRLKLDAVKITVPGKDPIQYTFSYNELERMPSKYSFSQDHYGFYNDIDNTRMNGFIPTLANYYLGGDRRVKPEAAKAFSLKSITYPEKGKTEFVYEGNTSGIINIPDLLLANYQDDNFIEKYSAISVSSYSHLTSYPAPDQTANGKRYFRKRFTIAGGGYSSLTKNWAVGTNFGLASSAASLPAFANNVEFILERINPDNSRVTVRRFNTTDMNYSGSGNPPRTGQDDYMVGLGAGEYEMTVAMTFVTQPNTPADNQPYNLSFFVNWREMDPQKMMVNVGGLRIKDINYYNHDNSLLRKKTFTYTNPGAMPSNPNYTSGQVVSFPQYFQYKTQKIFGTTTTNSWIEYFSSNSILPLETTSGSAAGYEFVDEFDVNINNASQTLRTNSHFSFDRPYFSQYYLNKTKGLIEPMEWTRGKLLDRQYFNGGVVIKTEKLEYNHMSPHLNSENEEEFVEEINTDLVSFQSLSNIGLDNLPEDFYDTDGGIDNCVYYYYNPFNNFNMTTAGRPTSSGGVSNTTCNFVTTVPYFAKYTGFDKPKKKTTTNYNDPNNPIITVEDYTYGRTPIHYQLTKTTSVGSDNKNLLVETKYPYDVTLSGTAETARLKLINNHQINTTLLQTNAKNGSSITSKTDYKLDAGTSLVVPDVSKTNTLNGQDEIRDVYYKFDDRGNVLSLSKAGGVVINYIWSYNKQYPIAEIKNADYAAIVTALGGATAVNNFANGFPVNKAAIDTFLAPIRNSTTTFKDTMITTYTYEPLIGMTSMTDPKGMTTHYEYDDFQRLMNVKDQDGNIIKNFDYHYKP